MFVQYAVVAGWVGRVLNPLGNDTLEKRVKERSDEDLFLCGNIFLILAMLCYA